LSKVNNKTDIGNPSIESGRCKPQEEFKSDHAVPGDKVETRRQTLANKRYKKLSQNNNRCMSCMCHIFNRET